MREPGELDMKAVDAIHEDLMAKSNLYKDAYENGPLWLVVRMQLAEAEKRLAEAEYNEFQMS